MTDKQYALLGIVGGALAVAGCLLPWVSLSTGFGEVSVSGTRGDGIIFLFVGLIVAGVSFGRYAGATPDGIRILVSLAGLGLVAYAIWTILRVTELAESQDDSVLSSVGVGLYLLLAGGVVSFVSGAKGKAQQTPAPPAATAAAIPTLPTTSPAESIVRLDDLRQRGAITEEEYQAKKAELLARM